MRAGPEGQVGTGQAQRGRKGLSLQTEPRSEGMDEGNVLGVFGEL